MEQSSKPSNDQIELALRLMDDDEDALRDVLRLYGRSIAAALRNSYECLNYEDVEDILSIAAMRLWDNRQKYDESQGTLRTYFYKIADNTARDVFKHGWHRARSMEVVYGEENDMDGLPCTNGPPAGGDGKPASRTNSREETKRREDLRAVVGELPEKQRHIIQADAYARDDVAHAPTLGDELRIPATTVRVYRGRAMETIRRKMRERGHNLP